MTRIVGWSHELLAEKISAGQLAVDLTAGNGYDALILWRLVGAEGQVIAFDIQPDALRSTRQRLEENGAQVRSSVAEGPLPAQAGVDLVAAGHQNLNRYLPGMPQAIIANLGYFPGGDQQIVTRPETTLRALQQATDALAPGGRLAVVVYTGHPGGRQEGALVDDYFASLCHSLFQVLQLKVTNRPEAPHLISAEF